MLSIRPRLTMKTVYNLLQLSSNLEVNLPHLGQPTAHISMTTMRKTLGLWIEPLNVALQTLVEIAWVVSTSCSITLILVSIERQAFKPLFFSRRDGLLYRLSIDCDSNEDCDGILQCFFRRGKFSFHCKIKQQLWLSGLKFFPVCLLTGNENVPGCFGTGVSGRDYCGKYAMLGWIFLFNSNVAHPSHYDRLPLFHSLQSSCHRRRQQCQQ